MAMNIASQIHFELSNPLRYVSLFIFSYLWFASLIDDEIDQSCAWFEGPAIRVAVDGIIYSVPTATMLNGIIILAFLMAHIGTSPCGAAIATAVASTKARPDDIETPSFTSHSMFANHFLCDAPNPGCPLTTRQPAENLEVSYHETHT